MVQLGEKLLKQQLLTLSASLIVDGESEETDAHFTSLRQLHLMFISAGREDYICIYICIFRPSFAAIL